MRKLKVKIKSKIVGTIIGVIAAVMIFAGCGSSENETADEASAPVIESLDEDGNVITEDSLDNADSVTEVNDNSKNYLDDKDDEELRELAVEALEAAGLDTSLAKGTLKTTGIEFELPDGFEEDPDKKDFYVTGRYPIDASCICYLEQDIDYTLQLMDEAYFKSMMEEVFFEKTGTEVSVNITEFAAIKIDGVPSFRIILDYEAKDIKLNQLVYIINGSKTYIVIYSETDEFDSRMEEYNLSASTITVKK